MTIFTLSNVILRERFEQKAALLNPNKTYALPLHHFLAPPISLPRDKPYWDPSVVINPNYVLLEFLLQYRDKKFLFEDKQEYSTLLVEFNRLVSNLATLPVELNYISFLGPSHGYRINPNTYAYNLLFAMPNIDEDDVREAWETQPRQKIVVTPRFGLGDQICAEPTIRYIKEVLHPNADISVSSDYPELFTHIVSDSRGPNVYHDYEMHLECGTKVINTDSRLIHPIDTISIQTVGGQLPDDYKVITLPDVSERAARLLSILQTNNIPIERSVLLHCGVTNQSRTFPAIWWQGLARALFEANFAVIFMGRTNQNIQPSVNVENGNAVTVGEKTAHAFEVPNSISFVDKLELLDNIALVSICPVLVTNDSAPLHMAGAFDNHILCATTIKSPDTLFPHRRDPKSGFVSKHYKTQAIQIGSPWEIYEKWDRGYLNEDAHSMDPLLIEAALPSPESVVSRIQSLSLS